MNRTFLLLAFGALLVLAALFIFAGKPRSSASERKNPSVVITPDGKLTMSPQRDGWCVMTLTMDKPPTKSNSTAAVTNSNPNTK